MGSDLQEMAKAYRGIQSEKPQQFYILLTVHPEAIVDFQPT
jgi:hypothetical protein